MKQYYASLVKYASEKSAASLAAAINPTQRGNESRFDLDISKYPIDLEAAHKNAAAIGAPLHRD